MDTAALAAQYRTAVRALARMDREPVTRNAAARDRAAGRHFTDKTRAMAALAMNPRSRDLAGLLTEETRLSYRLREAAAAGQTRPELKARLNRTRRAIRQEMAA